MLLLTAKQGPLQLEVVEGRTPTTLSLSKGERVLVTKTSDQAESLKKAGVLSIRRATVQEKSKYKQTVLL
jgi:hypothetical protein